MSITSLTLLKSHMAIDHSADDALLAHKLDAAEAWVGNHIGTPFADHDPVPPLLTEAAMQLAAYWYAQREAVAYGTGMVPVPFGVHAMLASHKKQVVGHVAE
ncbi:head-tail connector protein [Salipiger sp.]|uniref:head-tail connector protein n=1 Tax=Salipiger sp. TaxID=2078585 RepID=UPI003A969CFF